MKYKFDNTDLIAGYIRELLHDFNLPRYKVYKLGLRIYNGRCYIRNNDLMLCQDGKLKRVGSYIYGQAYTNITTNLPITSASYDTKTHKYLGDYLRFLRDYKDIDLMPLYNCYANEKGYNLDYSTTIQSSNSSVPDYVFTLSSYDETHNLFIVPAKFGYTYTIGIDAQTAFEACCIIYTNDEVVDLSKSLTKLTYKKIPGASFRCPATYSTDIDATNYWPFEENLYILLKVPKTVLSTITVLEGDYTLNCLTAGTVLLPRYLYDDKSTNIKTVSKLSLMDCNSLESYAFSSRLVEYLLGNAITNLDDIYGNISQLLSKVYNDHTKPSLVYHGMEGIWDNTIKKRLYEIAGYDYTINTTVTTGDNLDSGEQDSVNKKKKLSHLDTIYDLLGYEDKDMEAILRSI